ncbi:hypothetical protein ACFQZC_25575 [Streptacidiphilus monticola]
MLGICLGGQILAHALGGTVRRRDAGPELGAVPLRRLLAVTDDPVFGTVPEEPRRRSGTGTRSPDSRTARSPCSLATTASTRPSASASAPGACSSTPKC